MGFIGSNKIMEESIFQGLEYCPPAVLEADEGPLNVEHVIADDIGLAVFHQELEVVHGLLDTIII